MSTGALEYEYERSSTSTSARVLECEGSDLRVKLEYECSSARVLHIETRE